RSTGGGVPSSAAESSGALGASSGRGAPSTDTTPLSGPGAGWDTGATSDTGGADGRPLAGSSVAPSPAARSRDRRLPMTMGAPRSRSPGASGAAAPSRWTVERSAILATAVAGALRGEVGMGTSAPSGTDPVPASSWRVIARAYTRHRAGPGGDAAQSSA